MPLPRFAPVPTPAAPCAPPPAPSSRPSARAQARASTRLRQAAALGLLLLGGAAQATELVRRTTNVFGNFLVGAGPVADSGSFSELLSTLAPAYDREASDAGAVNDSFRGTPVQGSASFGAGTHYSLDATQLLGRGHAETTAETPFDHVSLGANAISSLRLDLRVPVLTPFVLTGSVLAAPGLDVGSRRAEATASLQFSGCVGCSWTGGTEGGGFQASGWLLAGSSYSLTGRASSTLNGSGQYQFALVLGAVPEPGAALLLALGLAGLAGLAKLRRQQAPGAAMAPAAQASPAISLAA